MQSFRDSYDFSSVGDSRIRAEHVWQIYFDSEFNGAVDETLGFKSREVLTRREDDDELYCETRIVPARNTPALLRKLGIGEFSYVEIARLDKKSSRMDLGVRLKILDGRLSIDPSYEIESLADGTVRRTLLGTVEVRVAMVGSKIEKMIVDDIVNSHQTASQLAHRWLTTPAEERHLLVRGARAS